VKVYNDGVEPGGVYRFAPVITSAAAMGAGAWITKATFSNANLAYFKLVNSGAADTVSVRFTVDGQVIQGLAILASAETFFWLDVDTDTIDYVTGAAPQTPRLVGYDMPLYAGYGTIEARDDAGGVGAGVYTWTLRYYAT
jgi:hypothetical protein